MLVCLTIPDLPENWPAWLEQQLIGLQLAELVEELPVFTGVADRAEIQLADVLQEQEQQVYQSGLEVLSPIQIKQLLTAPHLLFELQEQILLQGGEYWAELSIPASQRELLDDQRKQLAAEIAGDQTAITPPVSQPVWHGSKRSSWKSLIVPGVALLLLVGIITMWNKPVASGSWGFQQSGLLSADLDARAYLDSLAEAAGQWFNKRPESAETLATRLQQFSEGCQTLITALHPQLSETDKDWLIERCQAWKDKIDKQLVDLQTGQKSYRQTLAAADETINKLITALRDRSVTA